MGLAITEVGAKKLSNETVMNWLIAAKIIFHSDTVHSTFAHKEGAPGLSPLAHQLWKLLHMLESVYLNVNYL